MKLEGRALAFNGIIRLLGPALVAALVTYVSWTRAIPQLYQSIVYVRPEVWEMRVSISPRLSRPVAVKVAQFLQALPRLNHEWHYQRLQDQTLWALVTDKFPQAGTVGRKVLPATPKGDLAVVFFGPDRDAVTSTASVFQEHYARVIRSTLSQQITEKVAIPLRELLQDRILEVQALQREWNDLSNLGESPLISSIVQELIRQELSEALSDMHELQRMMIVIDHAIRELGEEPVAELTVPVPLRQAIRPEGVQASIVGGLVTMAVLQWWALRKARSRNIRGGGMMNSNRE